MTVKKQKVAVVGMALRVPRARTIDQFWTHLLAGRDCLRRPDLAELEQAGISPRTLSNPSFVHAKPMLDDVEYFDADFFGIPNAQAELMGPAQRIFLECVWEAMELGGIVPGDKDKSETTGVFAGVEGQYDIRNLKLADSDDPAVRLPKRLGNMPDYFALRVSHELNLVGPSVTALATCSTSLMAVHLAIQNLRAGECTVAVAGGAFIDLPRIPGYWSGVEGMFSPSGRIRPFDADADGTIFGEGAGVVVLKLLDDAIRDGNSIFGVILGTGYSNDGKPEDKQSFIAPAASGQIRAINHALEEAEVDARTIQFVECHGTGTSLGDPVEVASLTQVYRNYTPDTGYCALGAVKGNIGHLSSAAGVVGLIKACLALTKGIIPPMANFNKPNPEIDFEISPFFINTRAIPWAAADHPKRAGVCAFGFGGANAHVVLEEFVDDTQTSVSESPGQHLLVISAKTERALRRRLFDLAIFVDDHPETPLRDIAHTLQCGRQAMTHRACLRVDETSETSVSNQLRRLAPATEPCDLNRPVVFLFPGQGSQVPGMGQGLYENEPVYRQTIDYCSEFLKKELGFDLRHKIHRFEGVSDKAARAALTQTSVAQPALFIVEYALARLFQHRGLQATAMLGHSLGELVAACLAGVYSLDTGLRLVAIRSRLMQKCDPGSMVAVLLPHSELLEILPHDLDLAAVNSPTRMTVSGPSAAIKRFISELDKQGIGSRLLDTSHAFHSRMMEPIIDEFKQELAKFEFNPPTKCTISNVTGLPLTASQACDPNYWVDQIRQPVKFSHGLSPFLTSENPIFVEMGPERVLSGLVTQHDSSRDTVTVLHNPNEDVSANAHRLALESLGSIWSLGANIDWKKFYPQGSARKISLPTYPFQQFFHWQDLSKPPQDSKHKYPLTLYEPGWTKNEIGNEQQIGEGNDWLVFSDDQGVAEKIISRLEKDARNITIVKVGKQFRQVSQHQYEIVPGSRPDLLRVLSEMPDPDKQGRLRVLHFWTFTGGDAPKNDFDAFEESCNKGFHTLIALMQAAHGCGIGGRMDVQIYVDGLAQVDPSTDALYPEKGTLLGPCMVGSKEIPELSMRCIDIPGDRYGSPESSLIADIYRETAIDSDQTVTALRADGRYTEELFELAEIAHGLPRLRYGGTVLITGGVGGLGLKIAEHLYDTLNVCLVLTSRWQAPPREKWPDYVDQDTKIGRALSALSRLVDRQAKVLIVKADVRDRGDMERVVNEAGEAFGPIHGVVHAAGTIERNSALLGTQSNAQEVFDSKVTSAFILEELFKHQPLDMFIYFSSQASYRPGKGQAEYSAANAVLDRLARRRQQNLPGFACAIGWGAWREVGMAWEYKKTNLESFSLLQEKADVDLEQEYQVTSHPILKTYRKYWYGDALFSGSFDKGGHWIAGEHHIGKRVVVSGTSILELFRAGFAELHPNADVIEFVEIVFFEMFTVDDTTEYEILYVKEEDGYNVELRTRRDSLDMNWTVNARAAIREIIEVPSVDPIILEKLMSISNQAVKPRGAMNSPSRWQCSWAAEKSGNDVAVHVRLQDQFHDEIEQYGLHPSIFDRSIHCMTDLFADDLLPYAYQKLRIYNQMPAETLVHGSLSDIDADNAYDLVITDMSGNLIVQIEGYVMRAEKTDRRTESGDSRFSQVKAMVLGKTGSLNSFEFKHASAPPLKPGQVRVEVKAAGLNFRDVLSALGQLPESDGSRNMMGSECSGIISEVGQNVSHLRPGDRVVAVAKNCFATSVVADKHSTTYLPETLTFTEGASIPITFLTVDYALSNLARLRAGEKVLIHSATGGIGLAAVQIAQCVGAEIFATAGNESKRDYLRDLGIENVMDSRSLDFVQAVNDRTGGEGVDVVLNALAGEYIPASLGLLKPFGRFIEIGKRDIYADTKLGLYPFRNNLTYFAVDLGQLAIHRPKDLLRMFEDLMQRFAIGELRPSPVRVFPLLDIGSAFEYMARTKHIGKIVLENRDNQDPADVALEQFRTAFKKGISVIDGIETFRRLISSDETPPYVMAAAEPLGDSDAGARYHASAAMTRSVDTPYREPRNNNEEELKKIWEYTLGTAPIGIDDDFIELGGDSINAIMLQVAMKETLNADLPLAVLFRHPTIAKLGKLINEQSSIPAVHVASQA